MLKFEHFCKCTPEMYPVPTFIIDSKRAAAKRLNFSFKLERQQR